jgi:hypothetical protein
MPNSRDINKYPVLLFEAFRQASEEATTLQCATPQAAKNLRSLMYTLRQLLLQSPVDWHRELARGVAGRQFYINGSTVVISSPLHFITQDVTITH